MERWLLLGNLRLNISADIPTECFSSQLGGSKLGTENCLHLCMQKVSGVRSHFKKIKDACVGVL